MRAEWTKSFDSFTSQRMAKMMEDTDKVDDAGLCVLCALPSLTALSLPYNHTSPQFDEHPS